MSKDNCPFCNLEPGRLLIAESDHFSCIKDNFPITIGHSLIVSKRHCNDYFELTREEKIDLIGMIEVVCDLLKKESGVDGFNVGFNAKQAAGQTVFHTHIHVIPRVIGDTDNPKGGIRNILPNKGNY
jgi:diadenosine tetraphosphate (Ap4A) HIT family hydrolase